MVGVWLLLLFCTAAAVRGDSVHRATATGTVKCFLDGSFQPVPHVVVELHCHAKASDDTKVTEGRTSESGNFSLPVRNRKCFKKRSKWPRIKVIYNYFGTYGNMEVEALHGKRYYTSTSKDLNIEFDIKVKNKFCRAYTRLYHDGLKYYYNIVGNTPPYSKLYVQQNSVIHGGVFHSSVYTLRLSKSKDYVHSTARHEFAHTIRHSYDGSFYHFVSDVLRYGYWQIHYCSKLTNAGFAFNEGWAEYWADECYGSTGSDYRVEGNVASALRRLGVACGTSKAEMVEVLRYNPGRIHSFCEFQDRHNVHHQCNVTLPSCY